MKVNPHAIQLLHQINQTIAEYSARPDADEALACLESIRDEVAEPWAKIPPDSIEQKEYVKKLGCKLMWWLAWELKHARPRGSQPPR